MKMNLIFISIWKLSELSFHISRLDGLISGIIRFTKMFIIASNFYNVELPIISLQNKQFLNEKSVVPKE